MGLSYSPTGANEQTEAHGDLFEVTELWAAVVRMGLTSIFDPSISFLEYKDVDKMTYLYVADKDSKRFISKL